jgi:hypothetical protein
VNFSNIWISVISFINKSNNLQKGLHYFGVLIFFTFSQIFRDIVLHVSLLTLQTGQSRNNAYRKISFIAHRSVDRINSSITSTHNSLNSFLLCLLVTRIASSTPPSAYS